TMKLVYQRSGALELPADAVAGKKRTRLVLPELPPGWYEAALVMTSRGQFLAQQTLDIVVLADDAVSASPDERFGIIANDLPFVAWKQLPKVLPYLSAGRVKLGVWSKNGDIQQMDSAAFDQLLLELQEIKVVPTACLLDPPPNVARR